MKAWKIASSFGATVLSFTMLAIYDMYAVMVAVPGRVTWGKAGFTGAVSNAVSNTLGFHAFTGGALRYHLYVKNGLSAGEVARIVALSGAGIVFGFAGVVDLSLLTSGSFPKLLIGVILAACIFIAVYLLKETPRKISFKKWFFILPDRKSLLQQIIIGIIEMGAVITALYVLMPSQNIEFSSFALLYISATVLGIVSGSPGGIGVFEATMLSAYPDNKAEVLAALLLYRIIYNLIPFGLAVAAVLISEYYKPG